MQQKSHDNIATIRDEYRRIDAKWLRMQYRLMAATVAVEIVMFFILRAIHAISASTGVYLLKYLVVPFGCNLLLCGTATLCMRSGLPERRKAYAVSLLIAVMAMVVYTVHSVFYALFLVFVIPMLMTTVYGDQRLTGITGLLCIVEKAVFDLFLKWDPVEPDVLSSGDSMADFGLSIVLLVMFYVACRVLITIEQEKNEVSINLERERQRYQEASVTDALTKVGNRQALRMAFQEMENQQEQRFFLAMMDLDDFKSLNDTFGHSQGDQYLRALGLVLNGISTEKVLPFRFGGDEFCVLFCGCDPEEVREICDRIQRGFQKAEIHQTCREVSISIGVAEYRQGEKPVQLLDRADAALYQAKQEKGSVHFG